MHATCLTGLNRSTPRLAVHRQLLGPSLTPFEKRAHDLLKFLYVDSLPQDPSVGYRMWHTRPLYPKLSRSACARCLTHSAIPSGSSAPPNFANTLNVNI
jgi:hypothetical protein